MDRIGLCCNGGAKEPWRRVRVSPAGPVCMGVLAALLVLVAGVATVPVQARQEALKENAVSEEIGGDE